MARKIKATLATARGTDPALHRNPGSYIYAPMMKMNTDAADNGGKLYYRVASIGEAPPGTGCQVEVAGEEIAVFNFNGEYYAISDMCPHRGASLAGGFLDDGKVFCPWHCFDFNLKTGECATVPSLRVRVYEVKIAGEDIFVAC